MAGWAENIGASGKVWADENINKENLTFLKLKHETKINKIISFHTVFCLFENWLALF